MNAIRFGALVNLLTTWGMKQLDSFQMEELYNKSSSIGDVTKVNVLLTEMQIMRKEGNIISSIKAYRDLTGCDLRTAKDAIERYR